MEQRMSELESRTIEFQKEVNEITRLLNCVLVKYAAISFRNAMDHLKFYKFKILTTEEYKDLYSYFNSYNSLISPSPTYVDVKDMINWINLTFMDSDQVTLSHANNFTVNKNGVQEIIDAYIEVCPFLASQWITIMPN